MKDNTDALVAIGEALGVHGKGKRAGERLVRRPCGKPIDMQTRLLVAARLMHGRQQHAASDRG